MSLSPPLSFLGCHVSVESRLAKGYCCSAGGPKGNAMLPVLPILLSLLEDMTS